MKCVYSLEDLVCALDWYPEFRNRGAKIDKLLLLLTPREEDILRLRTGDNSQTLQAIGAKYGISRERVRQIEAKAIRKLRKWLRDPRKA